MEEVSRLELEQLIVSSGAMYGFLARFYRKEVDQALMDQIQRVDFSAYIDIPEVAEGYKMMDQFLRTISDETIVDLAVDYARVFLGCGPRQGEGAFPYESVYTSPRGLIMQEARDEVVAFYKREGLIRDQSFNEPEDHIAFELVFMEYLCQKACEALKNQDDQALAVYFQKEKEFMENHLMNWVPAFCADVEQVATSDFYKAVARITVAYLKMEHDFFNQFV